MDFQSTVLAEVAHKFKLGPGEDVGRFRVSVQASYPEYFESALFTEEFEVKSRTRAMAELRTAAFADVAARNERTEKSDFGGWTGGSGNDIHGFRTTGDLPEEFKASALVAPPTLSEVIQAAARGESLPMDPRTAQRAAQRQRLVDVRAYLANDPNAAAALKAIDHELGRFDKAETALARDRSKGWQPFEVRGTYLAREEGVPSGPLDLYGTVHMNFVPQASKESAPHLDVVVQIRDMSKRFDNSDMTFTGRGIDFEAALRAAFVDCAKAYPNGELAIQAEGVNADALPRSYGGDAVAGHGAASTGKVIGFQLGTDSRWKRVKEKVWSPIANIAVNLGAIALMAFVPASAPIVAPLLIAYNTVPIVDNMVQEAARGALTWGSALTSVGAIALNVLPMLGQAKAFSGAWFALEGANWGGQGLLLTADALAQARQLQGQDVAALGLMYKELMALGPADASSPRAKALQAEIAARAHDVSERIGESFRDLVGQNLVIAVAGTVVHQTSVRARAAIVAGIAASPRVPVASVHAGGDGVGDRLGVGDSAGGTKGAGHDVGSSTPETEGGTPARDQAPARDSSTGVEPRVSGVGGGPVVEPGPATKPMREAQVQAVAARLDVPVAQLDAQIGAKNEAWRDGDIVHVVYVEGTPADMAVEIWQAQLAEQQNAPAATAKNIIGSGTDSTGSETPPATKANDGLSKPLAPIAKPATPNRRDVTAERAHTLRQGLPPELHAVPIVENDALHGKDMQVRYRDGELTFEVGPNAGPRQMRYHVVAAQRLKRYQGPLGVLRRLLSRIMARFGGDAAFGTEGFEAKLELDKLRAIEQDVRQLLAHIEHQLAVEHGRSLTESELEAELASVQEQIDFYERRVDSKQEGTGVIAAKDTRIDTVVPGLYDSIDPNQPPKGWQFKDDMLPDGSIRTRVVDPAGKVGSVKRLFDKKTQTWKLEEAFFAADMARWVPAEPGLVNGKGTPLLAYADMRQMKLAGIGAGSLKTVKMSTIQNMETICQLAKAEQQGVPIDEAVRTTHSVAYAATEIVQSGHIIANIAIKGGSRSPIGTLMEFYEDPMRRTSPSYRTPAQHDEILVRYGLTRQSEVLWDFDIEISLGGKAP